MWLIALGRGHIIEPDPSICLGLDGACETKVLIGLATGQDLFPGRLAGKMKMIQRTSLSGTRSWSRYGILSMSQSWINDRWVSTNWRYSWSRNWQQSYMSSVHGKIKVIQANPHEYDTKNSCTIPIFILVSFPRSQSDSLKTKTLAFLYFFSPLS